MMITQPQPPPASSTLSQSQSSTSSSSSHQQHQQQQQTSSNVVIPFKKFVNTLSIDCTGRFALLAGQKALYVLDLSLARANANKSLQREAKRQASAAEWNPHPSHAQLAATAAHTHTFLWQLDAGTLLASIHSHRRAVTDLHWSPHDANLLATCSADTYVNVWDVRSPRSSLKIKAFCGYTAPADAVRWARLDRMQIASAHGNEIRVWDVRREAAPLALITAHMAKITALDWSYSEPRRLLSGSQDRAIKFWDVDQPRESLGHIHTGAPVHRALYAPLGHGVANAASRIDYAVRLWSCMPLPTTQVHAYTGHTDAVQAIAWRVSPTDPSASLQLVSLAADQTIRLWRIEPPHQQAIGVSVDALPFSSADVPSAHAAAAAAAAASAATASAAAANANGSAVSGDSLGAAVDGADGDSSHSLDLAQEFGLLHKLPGVVVDRADTVGRVCVVSCAAENDGLVRLKCTFPLMYPYGVPPQFNFLSATTLSTRRKAQLKNELNSVALGTVETGKPCLARCLRMLVAAVASGVGANAPGGAAANVAPPVSTDVHQSDALSLAAAAALADVNLPAPRASGVAWSPRGDLFFFANFSAPLSDECRTLHDFTLCRANRTHLRTTAAMSALEHSSSSSALPFGARRKASGSGVLPSDLTRGFLSATAAAAAVAAAASSGIDTRVLRWRGARTWQLADEWLAHRYETGAAFTNQSQWRHCLSEVCRRNGQLAAQRNRSALALSWKLVADIVDAGDALARVGGDGALVSSVSQCEGPIIQSDGVYAGLGAMPWATHVLGAPLMRSIIDYYRAVDDVQMLAMLGVIVSLVDERAKRAIAERMQPAAAAAAPAPPAPTMRRMSVAAPPPPHSVGLKRDSRMLRPHHDTVAYDLMPISALQGDLTGIASSSNATLTLGATDAQTGGGMGMGGHELDWNESDPLVSPSSSSLPPAAPPPAPAQPQSLLRIGQNIVRRTLLQSGATTVPDATAPTPASLVTAAAMAAAVPLAPHRKRALITVPDVEEVWRRQLLTSEERVELDRFRLYYADLLFRWGALEKRSELLSMPCVPPAPDAASDDADSGGVALGIVCARCGRSQELKRAGRQLLCDTCNRMPVACSMCRLPVRGIATFCIGCGHGGHAKHMAQWFARHTRSAALIEAVSSPDGAANAATGPAPVRAAGDDEDDELPRCPMVGCGCNCTLNVWTSQSPNVAAAPTTASTTTTVAPTPGDEDGSDIAVAAATAATKKSGVGGTSTSSAIDSIERGSKVIGSKRRVRVREFSDI